MSNLPNATTGTTPNFGRNVNQHDVQQFWNSSGRHIWDQVMSPHGQAFDAIGMEDLEADNSILLLTSFVERSAARPPVYRNKMGTYDAKSVSRALGACVEQLSRKFFGRGTTAEREDRKEQHFPSADVKG